MGEGRAYAGPLRHEWDAAAYRESLLGCVHDYIAAGDIYQANLSFRSRFTFAGDPLALYRKLRDRAAAAHGAFVDDGARQILSLSPELFFEISCGRKNHRSTDERHRGARSRRIVGRAGAGSARQLRKGSRGKSDDRRSAAQRSRPLAQIGSVSVPDLFAVETYPTLHTMVSTVTAQLKPGRAPRPSCARCFPAARSPARRRSARWKSSRELEESARGVYCGAIGFFAPDGSASFNVAIRTLTIDGDSGQLGIGGAVVQDSTVGVRICRMSAQGALLRKCPHADRIDRNAALRERLCPPGEASGSDATLGKGVGAAV